MRLTLLCAAAMVAAASFAPGSASANVVTAFGDTITGPSSWSMSSTSSTYGGIDIQPSAPLTFSQLTNLSATFQDLSGGADGGSPRFSIGLQNGATEAFLHIFLGTSPNFNDSNPGAFTLAFSGFNVIGNNDTGRYDDSQFGGSPFTNYASALALVGGLTVDDIDFVVDGGWATNGTQSLQLDSVGINGTNVAPSAAVPEPASCALFLAGIALLFVLGRRSRANGSVATI